MPHEETEHCPAAPSVDAPPRRRRPRWRTGLRWIEHLLAAAAFASMLLVLTPLATWIHEALDCQGNLEPARYIICLGGEPDRVIEGARLFSEGYGERLIVTNSGPLATLMRDLAIDWGVPPDKIVVDDQSLRTRHHPEAIRRAVGLDPARDACIIVTSYTHMLRSKATFEKAGYRRVVMREPRWEREFREATEMNWRGRVLVTPHLLYEGAAWIEYWLRGVV